MDPRQDLREGLQKAILAEKNGHYFYLMAAKNSTDPKGKEIFEGLAKEELDHMNYLKAHYKSVSEHGKLDETASLTKMVDLSGASPIFSNQFKERLGEAHFEMTALSVGIQLELNAMNYYRSQAEKTTDAAAKKFYNELADWESGHYNALMRQHDALKEDYWSDGGFSPF